MSAILLFSVDDVKGVCNFLGSVSSQQKFEVTDVKPPWHVTALGQISVTAPCYSSVLFRKEKKIHSRGLRGCQPIRWEEKREIVHSHA